MARFVVALSLSLLTSLALAQNSSLSTPQAADILRQAITAMGGSAPSDLTATGTITTTTGSATDSGTVVVMTRGTDQTSEQIQTSSLAATLVYSRGIAAQIQGNSVTSLPNESGVTTQSADFPLPLLVGMLNDPNAAYRYVGHLERRYRPPRAALENLRIRASPHCARQLLGPRYLAGCCFRPAAPHFLQQSPRARRGQQRGVGCHLLELHQRQWRPVSILDYEIGERHALGDDHYHERGS